MDIGGGRHLYLVCKGKGSPTVILESGYHDSSSLWSEAEPVTPGVGPAVLPGVAGEHRVCAYDRPGTLNYETSPPSVTTRSSAVRMPRTAQDVAADLAALLAAARLPTPVIIVAHSLGGLFALTFAREHPASVAGLVLVDIFAPSIPKLFGANWPVYRDVLNQSGAPAGNSSTFETIDIDASITHLASLPALRKIPSVVLSKTEPFALGPDAPAVVRNNLERIWLLGQSEVVGLEPNTPHITATGSDHYVQVRDPDLVILAVRLVSARIKG